MAMIENPRYQVRTQVFDGPLDLLLHLIKKNELDIYDISVSEITDQYLAYLQTMREMNLEVAGEYLVMAATLAYMKSSMLLPPTQEEEEEEESGESLRQRLIEQLLAYRQFKDVAAALAEREILSRDVFCRPPAGAGDGVSEPSLGELSVVDLARAFQSLLERSLSQSFHGIVHEEVSVKECLETIRAQLASCGRMRFADLFEARASRLRWVATFLALLELIKIGFLCASQEEIFGEIWLVRKR